MLLLCSGKVPHHLGKVSGRMFTNLRNPGPKSSTSHKKILINASVFIQLLLDMLDMHRRLSCYFYGDHTDFKGF